MAFTPDSQTLVTGASDGQVRVWKVEDGEKLADLKYKEIISDGPVIEEANSIVFSPDGKKMAFVGARIVHLFQTSDWEKLGFVRYRKKLQPYWAHISSVQFDSSGTHIVVTDSDNEARVWDIETNSEVVRVDAGQDSDDGFYGGFSAFFSPDDKTIMTSGNDNVVRIWDVDSGNEVARFGHGDRVISAAFSPDGKTIATASKDTFARIWDIESGREVSRFYHNHHVLDIEFSLDGKTVATASDDYTAKLWKNNPEVLAAEICKRLGRNPTAFEWLTYFEKNLEEYEFICSGQNIHPSLIDGAKFYAEAGDFKKASAIYRRVQELQPNLDLDPLTKGIEKDTTTLVQRQFSAARIAESASLLRAGEVKNAIDTYSSVQQDIESLSKIVSTDSWDTLCFLGTLYGYHYEFMSACISILILYASEEINFHGNSLSLLEIFMPNYSPKVVSPDFREAEIQKVALLRGITDATWAEYLYQGGDENDQVSQNIKSFSKALECVDELLRNNQNNNDKCKNSSLIFKNILNQGNSIFLDQVLVGKYLYYVLLYGSASKFQKRQ